MTRPHRTRSRSDHGFTLPELLIVVSLSGILIAALSAAIMVAIRVTPTSGDRIDDARSTRSLSTWLAQDTTSAPPFWPAQAAGGFNIESADDGSNNACGGLGTNVVHLQWSETVYDPTVYVANYRFVIDGDVARVLRYTCFSESGDPFTSTVTLSVTPFLDPTLTPSATITTGPSGDVQTLSFTLTGATGETVLIETTPRNPSDYFP